MEVAREVGNLSAEWQTFEQSILFPIVEWQSARGNRDRGKKLCLFQELTIRKVKTALRKAKDYINEDLMKTMTFSEVITSAKIILNDRL